MNYQNCQEASVTIFLKNSQNWTALKLLRKSQSSARIRRCLRTSWWNKIRKKCHNYLMISMVPCFTRSMQALKQNCYKNWKMVVHVKTIVARHTPAMKQLDTKITLVFSLVPIRNEPFLIYKPIKHILQNSMQDFFY